MIWQIVTATGWTVERVIWRMNYPNIVMMAADAPRYVHGERNRKVVINSEEDLMNALGRKYD